MGKSGDWICPKCTDHQFAKNQNCRRCGTPNPGCMPMFNMMAQMMNFAATKGASKGKEKGAGKGKEKAQARTESGTGTSWTCPNCQVLVFRRNSHCQKCGEGKPDSLE